MSSHYEQLLQQHEDPFGAYGPANDSTTIFSILPPLSILSPSQNLSRTASIKADDETPRIKRELSIVSEESKTPTVTVSAPDATILEADGSEDNASLSSRDSRQEVENTIPANEDESDNVGDLSDEHQQH